MEVFTYNYGETPDDVIRARHRSAPWASNASNAGYSCLDSSRIAGIVDGFRRTDDLITVLDALLIASNEPSPSPLDEAERQWWVARKRRARKRRIEILAALGIDESGTTA